MSKFKLLLCLAIGVILLGGLLVLSTRVNQIPENPEGTIGNTGGNLYHNGLFCEDEGQVFFSNPYDQNTLYVMNADETQVKKLTTVGAKFINAAGEFVYFFQENVGDGSGLGYTIKTNGIHRMKKDGSKSDFLIKKPLLSMNLINNNIYYEGFNQSGAVALNAIAIDKSSDFTAFEGIISPASASNGIIYYARQEDNFYLYSFDTRTNTNSIFWNHRVYNPIYHNDGYIYFMDIEDNYRIHRYNPFSGENQVLTDHRVENFNVYDNYIYYQKFSTTEPALMRMNTDGSNVEVVSYGNFANINITSNYVYYTEYGTTNPVYHQYLYGSVNPSIFRPQITAD